MALCLILICAGFLRFYNLGGSSFWVDELNHVFAGISLSKGEAPVFPSGVPNERAYLYSKFVGWSFSLFRVNEASARVPSAVLGLLSVLLVFWIGKRWFDERIGLVAAFLLAFAHPEIGWSRTCRMYTLFQFLFLSGVYLFYKGFESQPVCSEDENGSFLSKIKYFFRKRGVQFLWILLSTVVFLIALQVHQLAGLFAATLFIYFFGGTIVIFLRDGLKPGLASKYFIAFSIMLITIFVGLVFFHLGDFIRYALDFHPNWAKYGRAEDSHFYFWFLASGDKFPIAAFFFIGVLQSFVRLEKRTMFISLVFIVPLFFHSFVFSYKANNYIFNVLPFYFLVAAYSMVNLYDMEMVNVDIFNSKLGRFKRFMSPSRTRIFVTVALLIWIPLTVWFRIAVKTPFVQPGENNGAVTSNDWRDASRFIRSRQQNGDIVASTLPLTTLYYLGKVDYNLNLAHLDESLEWTTPATNGRHNEFYTGVPSVETVKELENLMKSKSSGWIMADVYRFDRPQYVSEELAMYIKTHLQEVWTDKNHTMVVYFWSS